MRIWLAAVASALFCSCSGDNGSHSEEASQPVPLPRAWPRTAVYDSAFAAIAPGYDIEANIAAEISLSDDRRRSDIRYPAYSATLHITDLHTATDREASAAETNRRERISIDTGDRPSEITMLTTPSGYTATIVTTPVGSITPLHFIARGKKRVVSGTLVVGRLPSSADSIAPTLKAVERDITHLITSLR